MRAGASAFAWFAVRGVCVAKSSWQEELALVLIGTLRFSRPRGDFTKSVRTLHIFLLSPSDFLFRRARFAVVAAAASGCGRVLGDTGPTTIVDTVPDLWCLNRK